MGRPQGFPQFFAPDHKTVFRWRLPGEEFWVFAPIVENGKVPRSPPDAPRVSVSGCIISPRSVLPAARRDPPVQDPVAGPDPRTRPPGSPGGAPRAARASLEARQITQEAFGSPPAAPLGSLGVCGDFRGPQKCPKREEMPLFCSPMPSRAHKVPLKAPGLSLGEYALIGPLSACVVHSACRDCDAPSISF